MVKIAHQNLSKISTKSAKLALFLAIIALIPQNSTQLTSIEEQTTVTGTCTYSYSPQNVYSCDLSNVIILNPTDVLQITGTHLLGHTNADVQAVNHLSSTIAFFNGEILRIFVNLRRIQLVDQGLRQIMPNAFEFCPHLEEILTGLDGQLTTFPPQMLRNCVNLHTFQAVMHNLTFIPDDLFGATRNLVDLNLVGNQLTFIPENLLQNMVNLRNFNVGSNLLTQLSPNVLRNAVNLEEFGAAGNRFTDPQIIINVLNGHLNLQRLFLINNNFANFNFQFFSQFQRLTELTIGTATGQRLTQISWHSLPSSLTSLRVEGIGEELPGTAFNQLLSLTSLTFSGSGITSLQSNTFSSLTRLELLTITNTNLRSLHPQLFTNQASLINLNLNNNQIEELPAGIFVPLVNIGTRSNIFGIRMAWNNIQRLNVNSFGQHPHLRYIDFFQNRINEIERGIFSRFHSNLDYANFRLNVCISRTFFSPENLDNDDSLTLCFNNWAGITTTGPPVTTTTTASPDEIPTTTPGTAGSNFRKFEVFVIILIGILMTFW